MKAGLLKRLERLESVQGVLESDRRLKVEIAHLRLLPPEYSGPRHIVTLGKRLNGREECEERAGEPPPNQALAQDEKVLKVYVVSAREVSNEIRDECSSGSRHEKPDCSNG
jgi:hypothetical protein